MHVPSIEAWSAAYDWLVYLVLLYRYSECLVGPRCGTVKANRNGKLARTKVSKLAQTLSETLLCFPPPGIIGVFR